MDVGNVGGGEDWWKNCGYDHGHAGKGEFPEWPVDPWAGHWEAFSAWPAAAEAYAVGKGGDKGWGKGWSPQGGGGGKGSNNFGTGAKGGGHQELCGLAVGGDEVGHHTQDRTREEERSIAHGHRQRWRRRQLVEELQA